MFERYISNNVFDGRKYLTKEQAERHHERLKRALDRRKIDMNNGDGGTQV